METFFLPHYPVFFQCQKFMSLPRYGTSFRFKNLNLKYLAIFSDKNFQKNFVKRNRLFKQYGLRL